MRADMAKLIVERPRFGGGGRFPRGAGGRATRRLAPEDAPRREGMKRRWSNSGLTKGLNENLAPLRRYLLSNVGRPWNKVFSEICQHMNVKSAVQLHIWQHLQRDLVCLMPLVAEGGRLDRSFGASTWQPFVVDPRCGLLRKNESYYRWLRHARGRREKEQPSPNFCAVEPGRCYRRIEGIWYEFVLAPLPVDRGGVVDAVLKRRLRETSRDELVRLHGAPVYAVSKRQLNSREIRRLPLPE